MRRFAAVDRKVKLGFAVDRSSCSGFLGHHHDLADRSTMSTQHNAAASDPAWRVRMQRRDQWNGQLRHESLYVRAGHSPPKMPELVLQADGIERTCVEARAACA